MEPRRSAAVLITLLCLCGWWLLELRDTQQVSYLAGHRCKIWGRDTALWSADPGDQGPYLRPIQLGAIPMRGFFATDGTYPRADWAAPRQLGFCGTDPTSTQGDTAKGI